MKLLIADDHTLFRDALVQYIERAEPDAEVTVTKDFDEAYNCITKDQGFDLVLLDLRMPGMNGMGGFEKMREGFPDVKVALMSGVAEEKDVNAAVDLGARGYFPKTMSGKSLIQAIQKVLAGEVFVPIDDTTKRIMPSYHGENRRANFSYGGVGEQQAAFEGVSENLADYNLTPREKEVLTYLAKGASNKEIAMDLDLQVVTVKLHVRGICRKLNANNRTQAALKAAQMGIVKSAGAGAAE